MPGSDLSKFFIGEREGPGTVTNSKWWQAGNSNFRNSQTYRENQKKKLIKTWKLASSKASNLHRLLRAISSLSTHQGPGVQNRVPQTPTSANQGLKSPNPRLKSGQRLNSVSQTLIRANRGLNLTHLARWVNSLIGLFAKL